MRMIQIQENMAEQKNIKDKLENEQEKLHVEYNKVSWLQKQYNIVDLIDNFFCDSIAFLFMFPLEVLEFLGPSPQLLSIVTFIIISNIF